MIAPRRYRARPVYVDAVQWFPDPEFGRFDVRGRWDGRKAGYDEYGVTYTICDVGIQSRASFIHIHAGDWVITGVLGIRYPCADVDFHASYELVK